MDGKFDQAKGEVKQTVGEVTDNEDLKAEGKLDEAAGHVKEFAEDVKDKATDIVDDIKAKFSKD